MKNFDFNKTFTAWQNSYYTLPLMYLLCVAVIIYAIRIKPKNGVAVAILCFSGASLTQSIIDTIASMYKYGRGIQYINSLAISIFITVEITCCYWLVVHSEVSWLQKRAMQLLLALFYMFEVIYITPIFFDPNRHWAYESFVELPLVIVFAVIYYYNLLTKAPQHRLSQQPLFWAISGLALIAMVQIPCNTVFGYIEVLKVSYGKWFLAITCLSYSFLFVCFLKALHLHKTMHHAQKKQK